MKGNSSSMRNGIDRQVAMSSGSNRPIAKSNTGDHVLRAVPIVTFGVVILLGMASAWADGDMQQPIDSGTAVTTAATGNASH